MQALRVRLVTIQKMSYVVISMKQKKRYRFLWIIAIRIDHLLSKQLSSYYSRGGTWVS